MKFTIPVQLRKYALGSLAVASSMTIATLNYRSSAVEAPTMKHSTAAESEITRKTETEECDCVPMWECMQAKCNGDVCSSCEKEEKILRACLARVRVNFSFVAMDDLKLIVFCF
jgi:hypothetical protein